MEMPEVPFPGDLPPSADDQAALRGMLNREFLKSQKYQEQQFRASVGLERTDLANGGMAHPDILEFRRVFIKRMAKVGVPMFASEIWRTHERQDQLKADGFSNASGGNSPHQYGLAVDIVHSTLGWQLDQRQWALVGEIGKDLITQSGFALEWGGDWKTKLFPEGDPAHWQVINWRDVRNTTWPTKSKRQLGSPHPKREW